MHELESMEHEFYLFDRGEPRLRRIREAITEADSRNLPEWQFRFRYDYLEESIFCGDRYYAMIIFPEMLSLYEKHESLHQNARTAHDMLICFKWIVEAAPEFPQISRKEIDSYFRLFKKMLIEQGKSLSIYYMKHCLFYMKVDEAIAAADFYRFLEEPLDDVSDGKALYYDQQVMYYLSIDEEEKALESAKLIFAGKLRSNALPQATYHDFIRYYLEREQYPHAVHYAFLTERRVVCDPYYLDIIGTLLTLYSQTKIPDGVKLFSMHYELYLTSKNPLMKMLFAIGAYHLFRAMDKEKHHVILEQLKVARDALVFQNSPERIAEHFYQEADSAVQKFDTRNGTDYYARMLHLLDDKFQS
ncbi:MAG: hypothetical protein IJJ69_02270 [Oscillospiraceae bacterium]|nr:hypothetical protein [Oscillospiraceae bacterium]